MPTKAEETKLIQSLRIRLCYERGNNDTLQELARASFHLFGSVWFLWFVYCEICISDLRCSATLSQLERNPTDNGGLFPTAYCSLSNSPTQYLSNNSSLGRSALLPFFLFATIDIDILYLHQAQNPKEHFFPIPTRTEGMLPHNICS